MYKIACFQTFKNFALYPTDISFIIIKISIIFAYI